MYLSGFRRVGSLEAGDRKHLKCRDNYVELIIFIILEFIYCQKNISGVEIHNLGSITIILHISSLDKILITEIFNKIWIETP